MSKKLSILLVGESCIVTVTEYKGIDHFSETNYGEAAGVLIETLEKAGHQVTHIPCHRVSRDFPRTLEELSRYDVILFSDIGTNTFLLLPEVVKQGKRAENLLKLTKAYVEQGGGFCMIGGYMTYGGMDGKGKWKGSVLEEILPVSLLGGDDRTEVPEGARSELSARCASHTGRVTGPVAVYSGLQQDRSQRKCGRTGILGRRSYSCHWYLGKGPSGGLYHGLCAPLGPGTYVPVGALPQTVGQPGNLAGRRSIKQPADSM